MIHGNISPYLPFFLLNPIVMLALWSPHGFDIVHTSVVMFILTKIIFELSRIKHCYFWVHQNGHNSSCKSWFGRGGVKQRYSGCSDLIIMVHLWWPFVSEKENLELP
jgi:hypothetical protein